MRSPVAIPLAAHTPRRATRGARAAVLTVLLLAGCARQPRPVTAPAAAALSRVGALQAEIDHALAVPPLDRTLVAIDVESLDNGEVLYRLNANKLVMPASNMKLVTLAAAAERLGWDFTYETRLMSAAAIEQGLLMGDLVVVGSGDPTINGRGGSPTRVFEDWADKLRAMGIQAIAGRVLGDGRAFADERLGAGWSWDYLGYGYAAPIGALQFNEDLVEVAIRPGTAPGDAVRIELRPPDSGLVVSNRATTSPKGEQPTVELHRLPGSNRLKVTGSVPAETQEYKTSASVDDPTGYFARALRATLVSKGIEVRGDAADLATLAEPPDLSRARLLLSHQSPPLSELARTLMKVSQNLYAETLLRTLGAQRGDPTAESGRKVVQQVLESWGIPPDALVQTDGSGLSRYDYVTAETLVRILTRMRRDPRHADRFADTLPIAGRDGTLARRMKETRAEGNARAKTGSIANVRALSGYVRTLDDEMLAFSIIVNNFSAPQETVDAVADRIVERLANLTRKE